MSQNLIDGLIIYGFCLFESLACILVGVLLVKNDGLRSYVGIRTQRGLSDPAWRRRAEKLAGKWYLRLGIIWTVLTVILFVVARYLWVELAFFATDFAIILLPLFALRTK